MKDRLVGYSFTTKLSVAPFACILSSMEKKPPADDSKNRFAEVIRRSQQRRQELTNKARKKQAQEMEPLPRDEEAPEPDEGESGV